MTESLDAWVTALAHALEISPAQVDQDTLLELAGEAAHRVERPAAPLTTYLVGLAAGRDGGGPAAVSKATAVATNLAQGWRPESATTGGPESATTGG